MVTIYFPPSWTFDQARLFLWERNWICLLNLGNLDDFADRPLGGFNEFHFSFQH